MPKLLDRIRDLDRRRRSFPAEHFLVALAGSAFLRSARHRRGSARVILLLAGATLLARAASGRDGLARLSRRRESQ